MKMEKFVKLMTGHFDNREQFTEMKSAGKLFPYARHVNTVCNDKINNIYAGSKMLYYGEGNGGKYGICSIKKYY